MKALFIISGLPCTGKTTLGRKLAKELSLPFISRDDIKESLFNSLGWQDREWSKQLGVASYALLYYLIETLVSTGISIIVESNFQPQLDNTKILQLKKQYNLGITQIHCYAKSEVLFQRFQQRSESSERHPGHVDHLNYEEFKSILLKGGYEILNIESRIFEVDSTNF
jgi:predicted kinase